jgi:outer membrane protein assembly factor BamB
MRKKNILFSCRISPVYYSCANALKQTLLIPIWRGGSQELSKILALAVLVIASILFLSELETINSETVSVNNQAGFASRIPGSLGSVTPAGSSAKNVTFRLLAVERYFSNTSGSNFPVKSAQYLIGNLTQFKNWNNVSWGGVNYKSYIHLLSAYPGASASKFYRGQPTNSNVINEIANFLGQTSAGESNNLTIRVFYYCGHSYVGYNPSDTTPVYMELDKKIYDYQLNQTLRSGDLATSNCTLVIFDSCSSGGFIDELKRPGRVVWTACGFSYGRPYQLAYGWGPDTDPPGCSSWFTGSKNATYKRLGKQYVFGPVGIIGGLWNAKEICDDGWRTAYEVYRFAWNTTITYADRKYESQYPRHENGVNGGGIPFVMYQPYRVYWDAVMHMPVLVENGFLYNAAPCSHPSYPPPSDRWDMFHGMSSRVGTTFIDAPNATTQTLSIPLTNPVDSSPTLADGLVIVGTSAGLSASGVSALDIFTGETVWKYPTSSSVVSTPAVKDGFVFFGTETPGKLYAVHEFTGQQIWMYEFASGIYVQGSPAIANGIVFIGTMGSGPNCGVYAFNQTTGEPKWFLPTPGPIRCSPAVSDGLVFVGTVGGGGGGSCFLYVINELSGTLAWQKPLTTDQAVVSTPAAADSKVFVATQALGGTGRVYAFYEVSPGAPAWAAPFQASQPFTSSPAVDSIKGRVVIGCQNGFTYSLNEANGAQVWTYSTGQIDMSSPAISGNGLVYIGSTNRYFYCLNETTGSKIWSYLTNGAIKSSPSITEDHVLVGSQDGKVYRFGPAFPEHDPAVLNVIVSPSTVYVGNLVNITYTVKNEGNVAESFNVTITCNYTAITASAPYIEPNLIHNETVYLNAGASVSKAFLWNTSGFNPDDYNIIVQVSLPQETYEVDPQDNSIISGALRIKIVGDINGDNFVNINDLYALGKAFGSTPLNPSVWNDQADFNKDLIINETDLQMLNGNFGKTTSS